MTTNRRPSLPIVQGVASAWRDDPRAALIAAELAERLPVHEARAALALQPEWLPVADVPATRGDCPTERPCRHVHCRHHLWMYPGDDRAGRRYGGAPPPSTLRPMWLESPMPASCALDLADAGKPMTVAQMAEAVGVKPARLHEILATAIAKLKAGGVRDDLQELDEP